MTNLEYPLGSFEVILLPQLYLMLNSDSIVDLAIHVCFEDFQDTTAPLSVKTYPLVDFESFESDIQFVS